MNLNFENIKLKVNHKVVFDLPNEQAKNILIFGNTINFFGFFYKNGQIDLMSMNENDRRHFIWLVSQVKNKANIYIIGEQEELDYYQKIFNWIGKHSIKCNVKFLKTIKPIDYINRLDNGLKNMKFDYIVGNPPFGSVGGDTLHLKCLDLVYDKFIKKMLIIMPWGFVTKDTRSFKKYQIKFAPKLQYVKEILGNNFEGTKMASAAIYEFTNEETETTILEDLSGNKTEKTDLTNISLFTPYEKEIIKYLESQGSQFIIGCGGTNKRQKELNKIPESEWYNFLKNNIIKSCESIKNKKYNSYLIGCARNGGMNGIAINSQTGKIFNSYETLLTYFIEQFVSNGYNVLCFNSNKAAENCKVSLQNPLLRFTIYKTQIDNALYANKHYKYVPAIDWEDKRCLTDEGLLEICGCPKDKAKEYAEYVKNYVEERDKEFESRKKKK